MVHRGNVTAPDPNLPFELPEKVGLNITDLSGKFGISQVLQPTSDIVALMTLEHQAGVANRIGGINVLKRTGTPEKAGCGDRGTGDLYDLRRRRPS